MKTYLLSIQQPDGPPPPPERLGPIMRDVQALIAELKASPSWVFNGGLAPPGSATVVRAREGDGGPLLVDGPYVEAKEHVGGVVIVRAEDLDGALRWAEKLARATTLPIEVRPFVHD